ncbi:MAG: DUF480 domain-containing protein [Phycisphaerae bacterium]|nr:MAG: DUF480 domain-containing protein [Planctomycetota bacterium]KAB2944388.1 MAG: DUF480 domain-containing protein [Phycisphaerae bacterium]MBE7457252.1 YceH family protein [Planctomycetia bacterium]MCK6465468.1 YceH family protein [Phycisphaerae bacterium]MCL4719139.1 DUF480 domain-containing protein [Phycisphaerae bacterium]
MQTLTAEEARLLGVLIEKSLTTPEAYPLTINAMTAGCNQKSNRDPVVEYDEGQVFRALNLLRNKGLVDQAPPSPGARSNRYQHKCVELLRWSRSKQAVMAELMLRGPQTVAELRARGSRMTLLADAAAVTEILSELMQADPPRVTLIPRGAGQREDRYAHLLCGPVDTEMISRSPARSDLEASPSPPEGAGSTPRLDDLERRIEALEARLARLESQT